MTIYANIEKERKASCELLHQLGLNLRIKDTKNNLSFSICPVFIAYETHTGADLARHVQGTLDKLKIKSFVAIDDLRVGCHEESTRFDLIRSAPVVLLLITRLALISNALQKEVRLAVKEGKRVLPFVARDVNLSEFKLAFPRLARCQVSQFSSMYELARLVSSEILNALPPLSKSFLAQNQEFISSETRELFSKGELSDAKAELAQSYRIGHASIDATERAVLCLLFLADYYHILDQYKLAIKYFQSAQRLAYQANVAWHRVLASSQLSWGHLLLHVNDLLGAKRDFLATLALRKLDPVLRARSLFRLGEVVLFMGDYRASIKLFHRSATICYSISGANKALSLKILADCHRKRGTAQRMIGNLSAASHAYRAAETLYCQNQFRGKVWLLHGQAELYRAQGAYDQSLSTFKAARIESERIFNINRVAHALLGECEVRRLMGSGSVQQYADPLSIYRRINSVWGIVNVLIPQAICALSNGQGTEGTRFLREADRLCRSHRLRGERSLIRKIKKGCLQCLHPLSLY